MIMRNATPHPLIMASPTAPPSYQHASQQHHRVGQGAGGFNLLSLQNLGRAGEGDAARENGEDAAENLLDLEFKTIFHEHKSTPTIPQVYEIYGRVFYYTKTILYNVLVLMFGIFFTVIFAMFWSLVAFTATWIWWPILRFFLFLIGTIAPIVNEPMKAFLTPLTDVHARIFRQIRINATLNGGFTHSGNRATSNV